MSLDPEKTVKQEGQEPAPQTAGSNTAPPGEERAPEKPPGKSAAREWMETVVIALLVALLIRAFVVQVYLVEGESMEPTLHTEERLLVNKFLYRFRDPQPGEIIVLQDPAKPQRELIKRVIAVAGETIEVRNGVAYVNGQPLEEPYKNNVFTNYPDTAPVTIPEGHVYVMGDNRGRSFDSRMIGPIALDKVDGKAFFMFWPLDRLAAGPLDHPREVGASGTTK